MCSNMPKPLTVRLSYDSDLENPCEYGGWKVYSFSRRHSNYRDPETLGFKSRDTFTLALRRKLETGTAFILSYYEHGQCAWQLANKAKGYPFTCQFDGVGVAGLMVWEDDVKDLPKGLDKRAEYAEAFIRDYTSWCNGEGYGFQILDHEGNDVESCWGYLGDPDYMLDEVAHSIKGHPFEVEGEARHYLDDKLRDKVEKLLAADRQKQAQHAQAVAP